jgi:hypothetical protein
MLNILEKKKNIFDYKSLNSITKKEKNKIEYKENNVIQDKLDQKEYNNMIYYPSSSKEWSTSIYSYNKSYIKSLISLDTLVNKLLGSYFNMLDNKIHVPYKRRRPNKSRYSADKIYGSRAEFKHTNTKLTVLVFIYNKAKISLERSLSITVKGKSIYDVLGTEEIGKNKVSINRLSTILKKIYFGFKKWNNFFIKKSAKLIKHTLRLKRHIKIYNLSWHDLILSRKCSKLKKQIYNYAKKIHFNLSKFNSLLANFSELSLTSIIEKIYNKKVVIKLVDLKSIHLNSDVFSSALALKLRDRKNKAVSILRKAILYMVKIPDLHTIRTFDDRMESMNKNSFLNVIKQQVVSGIRFEASGRLTRRLTAMRAVFKYRYTGSLKNLRSSLNNKASTILRGNIKSNGQYTIINSKTRNGSFGLKGWVSSH